MRILNEGRGGVRVRVRLCREIVDRHLGLVVRGLGNAEPEAPVRDDARARLLREARRAAEVIGVRVRDDDGVDVAHLQAGACEPLLELAPAGLAGQPRIHDRGAALVEERVAVHVAEAGHADRELHPQHAGCDLGHLLARRFLLLLRRLRHG